MYLRNQKKIEGGNFPAENRLHLTILPGLWTV